MAGLRLRVYPPGCGCRHSHLAQPTPQRRLIESAALIALPPQPAVLPENTEHLSDSNRDQRWVGDHPEVEKLAAMRTAGRRLCTRVCPILLLKLVRWTVCSEIRPLPAPPAEAPELRAPRRASRPTCLARRPSP